jgi:hypothetical protein
MAPSILLKRFVALRACVTVIFCSWRALVTSLDLVARRSGKLIGEHAEDFSHILLKAARARRNRPQAERIDRLRLLVSRPASDRTRRLSGTARERHGQLYDPAGRCLPVRRAVLDVIR